MYSIREIKAEDAALLRALARRCPPLDLHTCYTYWVIANYFGGFILNCGNEPVGFITLIDAPSALFIWQIGILPEHRRRGLSRLLYEAALSRARELGKDAEVTIADDNAASVAALRSVAKKNGIQLSVTGEARVTDLDDTTFCERETRYRLRVTEITPME